jgi:hypothetical protein
MSVSGLGLTKLGSLGAFIEGKRTAANLINSGLKLNKF